ncbi:MAG: hypothetical protein CL878_03520, partial [Dehalococcoidia bacterium]|nr:hypothetical protein [Dehalococcoidia bacterium]
WTTKAAMPTARQMVALVAAPKGKLFAIGGETGNATGQLSTVEAYDPATNTWTTGLAPMPTARRLEMAVLGSDGKIYAIGGSPDGTAELALVEVYDPASDTWQTDVPMPTARQRGRSALGPDGKLYAVGGDAGGVGVHTAILEVATIPGAPSPTNSTVVANPTATPADGIATSTVTVTVEDNQGTPLVGKKVRLQSDRGPVDTITPVAPLTNASGVATFSVSTITQGPATFTAKVGGVHVGPASAAYGPPPPTVPVPSDGLGSALDFDGVDDFVQVADAPALDLTSEFTLEVWLRQTGTQATGYRLVDKATAATADGYVFDTYGVGSGNRLRLCGQACAVANTDYALNTWHHAVVVVSGTTATFYLDGEADGGGDVGSIQPNALDLFIGRAHIGCAGTCGNVEFFQGQLDEVRIWSVARTQADIKAKMHRPLSGNEVGLVSYWQFDEGAGTTAADATSSGSVGTLVGGPSWVTSGVPPALLAQAREWFAATTVGNKALFAGGNNPAGTVHYDRVDIYDAAVGPPDDPTAWSTASLSVARRQLAATTVLGKALFGGGYDDIAPYSDRVDIYDSATGTWSTATLSKGRYVLAATSVGAKAIFAGGYDDDSSNDGAIQSNVVDIYDAVTGAWSTAALSQPRDELAATSVGRYALFAGGVVSGEGPWVHDVVDIYDNKTGQWTTHSLSLRRRSLTATTVGSKALFAGGYDGATIYDRVDIYDAALGSPTDAAAWSTATLSAPRRYLAATTIGHLALIAGGSDGTVYTGVVDIYNANTGTWSTAALSTAHSSFAATAVGGAALFAGGADGIADTAVVDVVQLAQISTSLSTVAAAPTSVLADGTSTSSVTVTVLDSANNPVPDAPVQLGSDRGALDQIGSGTAPPPPFTPTVSTVAGSTTGLSRPVDVLAAGAGTFYVTERLNHRIRKVAPDGTVTTVAGTGVAGYADGPGASAQFNEPHGVAADAAGNLYIGDFSNHAIRKIAPDGVVSTLAGSTDTGTGIAGYADGPGVSAQFNGPTELVLDAAGNLYVADFNNHRIRKVAPDGVVSTVAGTGVAGSADGPSTSATLTNPDGLALDGAENLYVGQQATSAVVRKIDASGNVSTLAGSSAGYAEGVGASAQFNWPAGLAVDLQGNVYVADYSNDRVRKIAPDGAVSTVAGTGLTGTADGVGTSAQLETPSGLTVGPDGQVYVVTRLTPAIRQIDLVGPPATSTTDSGGVATFNVRSTTLGPAVLTATAGGGTLGTVSVTFVEPVSAGLSTVSAALTNAPADGIAINTIWVTVRDGAGGPAAGKLVSLGSDRGLGDTIAPATIQTSASGVATFSLTSTVPGTAVLTATAGGITLAQTATVTFDPPLPSAVDWGAMTLSQARYGAAAATAGGKVLIAGGYGDSVATAVVDVYDPSTNSWSTAALTEARARLGATTVGATALFGGGASTVDHSRVDLYDAQNNSWSTASLSQARHALAATSVGNTALFGGGWSWATGGTRAEVDLYDLTTGTWTTATLSVPRSVLAATSVGGTALFAGGYDGSSYTSAVDLYEASTGTWSTASLSEGRGELAATSVGSYALFAGGLVSSSTPSAVVDSYEASTGTWSTHTLSVARSGLVATTVGTRAFFVGGYDGSARSAVVDIYDSSLGPPTDAQAWSVGQSLSQARSELAAVTTGNAAFFAGGFGSVFDTVDLARVVAFSANASTVTAVPSSVRADTVEASTVTVEVLDTAGIVPVPGVVVTLGSDRPGSDTIVPTAVVSSTAGVATFSVTSTLVGTSLLTATAGGLTLAETAVVSFSEVFDATITVTETSISPSSVQVSAGALVTTTSGASTAVELVVTSVPAPLVGPALPLRLEPGASRSRYRVVPGTYSYHLASNPSVTGQLVVVAPTAGLGSVSGFVGDATSSNAPLVLAEVRLRVVSAGALPDHTVARVQTDEGGSYTLPSVAPSVLLGSDSYRVVAVAPGQARQAYSGRTDEGDAVPVTAGQATTGIDFSLPAAGVLSGGVLRPDGSVIDDAVVQVQATAVDSAGNADLAIAPFRTTVVEEGGFLFTHLVPADYVVEARSVGGRVYAPQWYAGQASAETASSVVVPVSTPVTGIEFALAAPDTVPPLVSAVTPLTGSLLTAPVVSYTLAAAATTGEVEFTPASGPSQVATLGSADLTAGVHPAVALPVSLVADESYTVTWRFANHGGTSSVSSTAVTAVPAGRVLVANSVVTTSPTVAAVDADGVQALTVLVTLRNADGLPLPDRPVVVTSDRNASGEPPGQVGPAVDVLSPVTAVTDSSGVVVVTVRSAVPGTAILTVTAQREANDPSTVVVVDTLSASFQSIALSPSTAELTVPVGSGTAPGAVTVTLSSLFGFGGP